jgi:hypothetical protein
LKEAALEAELKNEVNRVEIGMTRDKKTKMGFSVSLFERHVIIRVFDDEEEESEEEDHCLLYDYFGKNRI